MSEFTEFKRQIQKQLIQMEKTGLWTVNVDKDLLWATYLNSFPAGTNPVFRERTEHDCNCCKQFIRNIGNVVTIVNNKVVSLWDFEGVYFYKDVATALSGLVHQYVITGPYLHFEKTVGTDFNHQQLLGGESIRFDHFYHPLASEYFAPDHNIASTLGEANITQAMFLRAMKEMTLEAGQTVLELINSNDLYRGEEHKHTVITFLLCKQKYDKLPVAERVPWTWALTRTNGHTLRFKNTVIGTLLTDLSEGMDLEQAVARFESKVAPTNYKRPTAVISKRMVEDAQAKVKQMGLENALQRRCAVPEDITINNVLFANRSIKRANGVFEELMAATPQRTTSKTTSDAMPIEQFITDILPKVNEVQVLLENRHIPNFMTLVAPESQDVNQLFQWDNNFSWAYNGGITDSIKERVKAAGGKVDGYLRASLSWYNHDDLDIHAFEPEGHHIFYSNKKSAFTRGTLDVDMNAGRGTTRTPVENIVWAQKNCMKEGKYRIAVNNFSLREDTDVGFELELECEGQIYTFAYNKKVPHKGTITVVEFEYSYASGIKILESIGHTASPRTEWGLVTQTYHPVTMVLNSPNHWDDKAQGNKHYFFILDQCKNPAPVRTFFNEYLHPDLTRHRKVFEVLGARMKAEPTEHQLSGIGFSSTQRNNLTVKTTGEYNRTFNIQF